MATLSFVLICYYMYSFFVDEAFYRLIDKLGCTPPQNEPDISLGIMHCYTYLNVFLDFFCLSFDNGANGNFSCLDSYVYYSFNAI